MTTQPKQRFTRLVRELPAAIPFVAPDTLERRSGRKLRLRLGANEGLFGPSPRVRDEMQAAVEQVGLYGDPESAALRQELARVHGVAIENIVVTCGIDDLLGLAVRAFVEPGASSVTSLGAYPTFNYHVLGFGGQLHRVPYAEYHNDLAALAGTARRVRARLVYLANPDNPTGTWRTAWDIQAFVDELPDEALLLLDEAYVEFAPSPAVPAIDAKDPRVLRMRTFSKAHGMAGARIGYGIATADTIAAFDKIRHHFGVNRIAQAGALASLADPTHVQFVVSSVAQGREQYNELARSVGVRTLPSAANFVAMNMDSPERARAVLQALEARGVFVRTGAAPLDRLVRVTVAPPAERRDFARIFREVLSTEANLRAHA
ncbi:MAG TPA: aminotransferase class I/II-fold pyridoxal phosphate-dependent enzyme [Polyangiaceae bacterium]|jgi:histidinol-phosphate aminotransferase|nr:aminotransferase class I/II-fold pyridoxal phosphate-dependent enzyme [Polyangiaceae bacterium]